MRLIVVRHARAKERDPAAFPDDALRPLSGGGRREFARFAGRVPRWLEAPALVLASGWIRAWDTARMLETEAGWPAPQRCADLETEGGPEALEALLRLVRHHRDHASMALVGHQPILGELIARILGADAHAVDLAKGAIAVLELLTLDPMHGELHALAFPAMFRKRLKNRA